MSQAVRERVKKFYWDQISADEKADILGWCSISDELMAERYPGRLDRDAIIENMSEPEFRSLFNKVMEIYRLRKKKRKSTIDMLRREGTGHANAQADKLEEEQRREDERAKELEVEQK